MLTTWRAGSAALRAPLVVSACVGSFVLGALTASPTDTPRTTTTQPAAAITDESVNRLAAALEAVETSTVPPTAQPTVDEAEAVLDAVRQNEVTVVVTPATVAPVQPTIPATPTSATTTTTTTERVYRDWPAP